MKTYAFNWAISLIIDLDHRIEQRLKAIIEYLVTYYPEAKWELIDIDATGEKGGELTELINAGKTLQLTHDELLSIFGSDGQIFELNLFLLEKSIAVIQIIVRTGSSIDVLGMYESLPLVATGPVIQLDINLFNPS